MPRCPVQWSKASSAVSSNGTMRSVPSLPSGTFSRPPASSTVAGCQRERRHRSSTRPAHRARTPAGRCRSRPPPATPPAGSGAAPRRAAPRTLTGTGADQGQPTGSTRGQQPRSVREPRRNSRRRRANGAGPAPGHASTGFSLFSGGHHAPESRGAPQAAPGQGPQAAPGQGPSGHGLRSRFPPGSDDPAAPVRWDRRENGT